jgi:hypothetical protein
MHMTAEQWAKCVQILNAALSGEMSAAQIEVYHRLLRDLPAIQVEKAVYKLLAENKWLNAKRYPNPAEIREAVQLLTHGQFASPEAAFERALAAVKRYGLFEPKKARKMCGETLWKCMRSIGMYERFCDATPDDRTALFAQFHKAWTSFASATTAMEALPEKLRPATVGLPAEEDRSAERKAIEMQLAKIGECVTLPLLDGEVAEPIKRPAKREGVSRVLSASQIDPSLPVNPGPGDDISRGYYSSITVHGEPFVRFFSAEAVAAMMRKSNESMEYVKNAVKRLESDRVAENEETYSGETA